MSDEEQEEQTVVEKAMEKDCILLVIVNEVLGAMKDVIRYSKPGWFNDGVSTSDGPTLEINTKCTGPDCAQYNQFVNVCGLR
jgi:hypothetical protein